MRGIDVARVRAATPGSAERIHLNNAGASLMPTPVIEAVTDHLELEATIGGYEAAAEAEAKRIAAEKAAKAEAAEKAAQAKAEETDKAAQAKAEKAEALGYDERAVYWRSFRDGSVSGGDPADEVAKEAMELSDRLKVQLDTNGFFLEAHVKLRPVELPVDFLCPVALGMREQREVRVRLLWFR